MNKTDPSYAQYVQILEQELIPATGCTEPIAIAYAAATAREALAETPDFVRVEVSGNIIKNVKSVVVPNTGGLKGIAAAAAAGVVAGKAERKLQVIAQVSGSEQQRIRTFLEHTPIEVSCLDSEQVLDIVVTVMHGDATAAVRVCDSHTNIVWIQHNGEVISQSDMIQASAPVADYSALDLHKIYDFANTVDIADIREVIDRQISCNKAIAEEGLQNDYGACIGKTLIKIYGTDVEVRAKAMAAAGSDARMSGCELPVVINSGSGNQGMTASLPVIAYAEELQASQPMLYRALVLSNLMTIYQKSMIGKLSAYCGAISAGAGAGAGIAYLHGASYEEIVWTMTNALAVVSGIICDGAKSSCAAKIATAVGAGILGYRMQRNGHRFRGGDGIVADSPEQTFQNVGVIGHDGMRETDQQIIRMMLES